MGGMSTASDRALVEAKVAAVSEDPVGSLWPFGIPHGGRRPSKHSAKPGEGRVRIRADSSLRKLMRAANRGKIPAERLRVILQAMQSALTLDRRDAHAHRHYDYDRSRVVRA